ncbi:MAG: hypothetical protein ACLFR7_00675 [Opitutales bacterium]
MSTAEHVPTMIADLALARISSAPSLSGAALSAPADSDEGGAGAWEGSAATRGPHHPRGEFRPMRWLVPWLWQLSQTTPAEGQPLEWEIDLPEGDRLKLTAVCREGAWSLDFSGSSRRLQRWLGQHCAELAGRLERIIGQTVRVYTETLRPLHQS